MGSYGSKIVAIASLVAYLALVPLAAYIISIPLIYLEDIRKPTHNITQVDLALTLVVLILVTIVALPIVLVVAASISSESSEESDNQEKHVSIISPIVGLSIGKWSIILLALLLLFFLFLLSSGFLVAFIVLVLVAIIALPLVLIVAALKSPESSEGSDNQQNNAGIASWIVGLSTGKKSVLSFVILALLFSSLFSSVFLVASNYETYDEYSGGEIGCHIPNPTYQSNIQEEEVISFSSLNEIDKKIFRMAINDSHLVSVRDDLSETEEYDLLVTKDRGYDEIVIYEGDVGGSAYFPPPDGVSSEPTMDISGSEYFSGGFEEKPNVRYQGETYWCLMDEFYVQGA